MNNSDTIPKRIANSPYLLDNAGREVRTQRVLASFEQVSGSWNQKNHFDLRQYPWKISIKLRLFPSAKRCCFVGNRSFTTNSVCRGARESGASSPGRSKHGRTGRFVL
jgi:hypothetical protein